MKKIEIRTKIVNGSMKRNRSLIQKAIKQFEGKEIYIQLRIASKQRSNSQNAYYWGVIIPLLQDAIVDTWGEVWNKEKCHEFIKSNFCYFEKVNKETGEIIKLPKSTTELTTTEMEDYNSQIREFMFEWFGVQVPLPNENITLNI